MLIRVPDGSWPTDILRLLCSPGCITVPLISMLDVWMLGFMDVWI
jgi:hypothetical protein